jgi:hypothetical protein
MSSAGAEGGGVSRRTDSEASIEPPVVWTAEALARVENAPAFVRAGIRKLMELRARERGSRVITSEFLTEIRDESMLRVSKSIKKFGFEDLQMAAFDVAKEKMHNHPRKLEVIDEIQAFLAQRTEKNQEIMEKFARYLEIVPARGIPWTAEALERLEKMPAFVREMAQQAIEEQARKTRQVVISSAYLDKVLNELLPEARNAMGSMLGSSGAAPGSTEARPLVALHELPLSMPWEEEPLQRLQRVPIALIRERLIRRVERHARRQGAAQVSAALFTTARFLPDDDPADD